MTDDEIAARLEEIEAKADELKERVGALELSHAPLHDRVTELETLPESHAALHDRVTELETLPESHAALHDRVTQIEQKSLTAPSVGEGGLVHQEPKPTAGMTTSEAAARDTARQGVLADEQRARAGGR